ncbi:MAG: UvrD-helicase domain-containing protein [Oscillospiraceae bacterium]
MEEARAQRAVERVKALRDGAKEQLTRLGERFDGDSGQLLADLAEARPAVRGLMDLVARFQEAYQREKARRGCWTSPTWSTLRCGCCWTRRPGGPPLAASWSARFAEVMVDEYQDTNQVQNAIFTAVSDGGRTLFQVGDVKQSIYRFRLADPTIFLDKYRRFRDGEEAGAGEPRRRVLSRNFRSRPQVLEGCNDLFRR